MAVEFYLSDSNLPFDKFLFTLWASSFHTPAEAVLATPVPEDFVPSALAASQPSKHSPFHLGWIPLSTLTSFKRMRVYLEPVPVGLGGIDEIAAALIAGSELVEVRKFGAEWCLRRTSELSRPEDAFLRSAYVKGFPIPTGGETPEEQVVVKEAELELQKKLEAWTKALGVGAIKSLRMRREDKAPVEGETRKFAMKGRGKFKVSLALQVPYSGEAAR